MVNFKILDHFYPWRIFHWRRKLWKSQYYSDKQLRTLQWKLLSKLLDHCFENVPYYRQLFAKLGLHRSDLTSVEDLSRIPVLSNDVLLEQHKDFKADNFKRFRSHEVYTSGTTGTPMCVYWDRDSNVLEFTCQWRQFSWTGYRIGESFLDIRSRTFGVPNGFIWNRKCRGLEVSSDNIDLSNIEKYAKLLRKFRIKLWRGYPSSIYLLCSLLDQAGIKDVKPKYVVPCAESLMGYQRDFIESWAGIVVCDNYGLKQHNALICQCPEGGYHIASEYGIIEIINDDGLPVQPGQEGRIIATGLHNKAFPLLRYDTGDYAVRSDGKCSCGRTLPLVESIIGRADDRILNAKGKWVSGLQFIFLPFVQEIHTAQLVQKQRKTIDVYIIPAKDYSNQTKIRLNNEFKKKLGESMKIRIQPVQEIPFRSSGKFKFVVNKLETVGKT